MQKQISNKDLKSIGLKPQPRTVEKEFYFDEHAIEKNDSFLEVVTEFEANDDFHSQYIEFNGQTLSCRNFTKQDLQTLIKLM